MEDEDEGLLFFGFGSVCSLREEEDGAGTHLDSLRSVSAAAKAAFARRPSPKSKRRTVGFHIPKRTK